MVTWHAERAWIDRIERDVAIDVEDGVITAVRPGASDGSASRRLRGLTIPGLVNAHSHAFHRALRGRTHDQAGDFWRWRDVMYAFADRLDPDTYHDLARATYAEMALAGITHVYEFHYLHHDTAGVRYSDPNAMGAAVAHAADAAGLRLTLLDTCYLRPGFRGGELDPVQQRFSDGDVDAWAERVRDLRLEGPAQPGVAIHSVRAVDEESMPIVATLRDELNAELHVHVSEQRRENEECMDVHQMSPTELLATSGALGPRSTAVHATHVTPMDVELLATTRTTVCMCPTTERDLADGVGPASAFVTAGARLAFGSDSHAVVDLFEEARCAELHERLLSNRRGLTDPATLLAAACGHRRLQPGAPADLVAIDLDSPRIAGGTDADAVARVVYCATAADVTDVVVAGRVVVEDRAHIDVGDVGGALNAAIEKLLQ
ncbi:MAG: formimidoylglutamate deiminase [Actinobacteria bacterium]|nr:formimidoylglutamate deiminase [Actinomycetota bacterium]